MTIYHIATESAWHEAIAPGVYEPSSLREHGFIHFSYRSQLLTTATRWFRGADDPIVVEVDEDAVRSALRIEAADGEDFPHLYAPLPLTAVVRLGRLIATPEGGFALSDDWQPGPVPCSRG